MLLDGIGRRRGFIVCCQRGFSYRNGFLPLDFEVAVVAVEIFVACCQRGTSNRKGFFAV